MLDKAYDILGYRFKDESILKEALTHASSAGNRLNSNERMEFLGDSILGYVVCEYLCEAYPELLEGELTKIKSAVVSRRVCALVSEETDLITMLTLGKGMSQRSNLPASIPAAVFEAIVAAIYMDGGIEPTKKYIIDQLGKYIEEAANSAHQENFKSVLQQYAQKYTEDSPQYLLLDEKGPDHAKAFEICVKIGSAQYGAAWANSKKEAEQKAALLALCEMDLAHVEEDGSVILHGVLGEPE